MTFLKNEITFLTREAINRFQYFDDDETNAIMGEYTDLLATIVDIAPTDGKYDSIMIFFCHFGRVSEEDLQIFLLLRVIWQHFRHLSQLLKEFSQF